MKTACFNNDTSQAEDNKVILTGLIKLLIDKKLITEEEINLYIVQAMGKWDQINAENGTKIQ